MKSNLADELNLAALIDASEDAIVGKTLDGTIVSWNRGAEKIYGYKAEEVLGHSINILIPPDRDNELPAIMNQLRRGQSIQSYETTRLHKDGHPIDVCITISPVKNHADEVVGACVVARNITRRKQAEDALRLSEERFRVALKNSPIVVFNQDLDLRYTWINSPVLAWANQDYLGRTDAEIVGGEEGARLMAIKQGVVQSGVGVRTEATVHYLGEPHCFDLTVEPLRDAHGTIIGVTCAAVDVSGREHLIEELRKALTKVKQLSGLLPICASCKRIRDEDGSWQRLEKYIHAHSEADFTHGVCPECFEKLYGPYGPSTAMPQA